MAVTNNVDSNVQNQISMEQFFQQSQPQPTQAEIQAQNDFLNQMNSAASAVPVSSPAGDNTQTDQIDANANPVTIPASETAQVQQLNADANAAKLDLNQKADQQIALGGTLTPPLDQPANSFSKPVGSYRTGITDAEKQSLVAINPSNQGLFDTDGGKQVIVWEGKVNVNHAARTANINRGSAVGWDVYKSLFGENGAPPNISWGIAQDRLTSSNSHPYADSYLYTENNVYVTVKQRLPEIPKDDGTLVAGNGGVGGGNNPSPPEWLNQKLEKTLRNKTTMEGAKFIQDELDGKYSKEIVALLIDAQKEKNTNKDGNNPIFSVDTVIADLLNSDVTRANKFIDSLLKESASVVAQSKNDGVVLGELMSQGAPGDNRFGLKAIEYAQKLRGSPLGIAASPIFLDAALTSLSVSNAQTIPKDLSTILKEGDYEDIAKRGIAFPKFVERIKGYDGNEDLKLGLITGLVGSTNQMSDSVKKASIDLFNSLSGEAILTKTGLGEAGTNGARGLVNFFKMATKSDYAKHLVQDDSGFDKAFKAALGRYNGSPVHAGISMGKLLGALREGVAGVKVDSEFVKGLAGSLGDTIGGSIPSPIDLGPAGTKLAEGLVDWINQKRIDSGEGVLKELVNTIGIATEQKLDQQLKSGVKAEEAKKVVTEFFNTLQAKYDSFTT
jgi:hypothetical protein